eukprot:TRINITY_DN1397_c0_g1_i1.p1 TRINITY_DN1397_c0_g1~~TRINITY_DN1397_c0_g1_i1.p1  ORF type:complete len:117 (-),score=42.24 TRINITY_DN1397_c0_g1_i1:102-452(-)
MVTFKPESAIRRYYFAVGDGKVPANPSEAGEASVKGTQTAVYCHVPTSSRYFIGIWGDGTAFSMHVSLSDPPECVGMTPSVIGESPASEPQDASRGVKSALVASAAAAVVGAAVVL